MLLLLAACRLLGGTVARGPMALTETARLGPPRMEVAEAFAVASSMSSITAR